MKNKRKWLIPILICCILANVVFMTSYDFPFLQLSRVNHGDWLVPNSNTEQPKDTTCTLQLFLGDKLIEQKTSFGNQLSEIVDELPDMRFAYAVNEDGEKVEPADLSAYRGKNIRVYFFPSLDLHSAYLFCDSDGFLYPEKDLSYDMLTTALRSLLVSDYEPYFDGNESASVDAANLHAILLNYFSSEELSNVGLMPIANEPVSRGAFAHLINLLLTRTEEKIVLKDSAVMPIDLDISLIYYTDLLEASIPHEPSPLGQTWQDIKVPLRYAPGAHLQEDGRLVFFDDNGFLVRNQSIGQLFFDSDGYYTSGDQELDREVAEILATIFSENPDADQITLLRCTYDYMLTHYQYVGGHIYLANATGWEMEEAKDMFRMKMGNCFAFAGAFWALARGLGFPAESRCRNLDPNYAHAWNDIEFAGVSYIFDPCLEQMKGNNRYMLTYENAAKYGYPSS